MKLDQYIQLQVQEIKGYMIESAEFIVCLDENGIVVSNSGTTIKFKIQLK